MGALDRDFGSALDAAKAIRERKISSVELTQHVFSRIDAFDAKLNAYVYQLREQVLAAAAEADKVLAAGGAAGVFHGVPISVKESFGVQGQPCTWGIPSAAGSTGSHAFNRGEAIAGCRMRSARRNQRSAFSFRRPILQRHLRRLKQPLGSGAHARRIVRRRFGFAGRGDGVPQHRIGHRREAEDLEAALHVLAGPEWPDSKAWSWSLPKPRHESLRDFRIGLVLEDPAVAVSAETRSVLEQAIRACERSGAVVKQGWRRRSTSPRWWTPISFTWEPSTTASPRRSARSLPAASQARRVSGAVGSVLPRIRRVPVANNLHRCHSSRLQSAGCAPSPHAGGRHPIVLEFSHLHRTRDALWLPGHHCARRFERERTSGGLANIAPFLEDATSIKFAELLAREIGGFRAPPGYSWGIEPPATQI